MKEYSKQEIDDILGGLGYKPKRTALGRPVEGERKALRSVYISDSDVEYLKDLAGGNISKGLRELIERDRKANESPHADEPLA